MESFFSITNTLIQLATEFQVLSIVGVMFVVGSLFVILFLNANNKIVELFQDQIKDFKQELRLARQQLLVSQRQVEESTRQCERNEERYNEVLVQLDLCHQEREELHKLLMELKG